MKKEIEVVAKWFSGERAISDMTEYTKTGLNEYQKCFVSMYFKGNDWILDIGCGMGRVRARQETFYIIKEMYI